MSENSAPVVMKFGGSSVADFDRIRRVAQIVAERAKQRPTVVVVSAMGKTTDRLVAEARALCEPPAPRELDMLMTTGERTSMAMLALALHGLGVSAISLTGSQCGMITNHQHGRARIVDVRPFRVQDELAAGHVVVVGGFQGVSYKREVTTLGRGGSDTSAVALAAALGADCEIYSDVDGVYDGDPRKVDEAHRIDALDYGEMQALSRAGAKVLHARAVELAAERGIAIYARASFPKPPEGDEGHGGAPAQTVIRNNPASPSGVRAVTCDPKLIELRLRLRSADAQQVAALARELGGLGLQYLQLDERGLSGLFSATTRDDLGSLELALGRVVGQLREQGASVDSVELRDELAGLSLIAGGLEDRADTIARALDLLRELGVELRGLRTDGQAVTFLIPRREADRSLRRMHAQMLRSSSAR